STGKAVDLKSTGAQAPWGFESLALRHLDQTLVAPALMRVPPATRACFARALLESPACPLALPIATTLRSARAPAASSAWSAASLATPAERSASLTMAYRR